jgi:hypothetical protein
MSTIQKLDFSFDHQALTAGLAAVLEICDWHPDHRQIGLTHALTPDSRAAWHDAAGSLIYRWGPDHLDAHGQLKRQETVRREADFSSFVAEFEHTIWRTVYDQLNSRYQLGRVRLMLSRPKTCLSWHRDGEQRIHIPIVTNLGARLVIEDAAHHLPADGSVYLADTTRHHTAFNSGLEPRIHMVACVLGVR